MRPTPLPERNLDLLRAIAVLCVLADHTLLTAGYLKGSRFLQWVGQAGICAFFVHTSLVLMASLERDDAPQRAHWIRRFYVRRAFRIYPLAWAVIAVVVAFQVPSGLIPAPYMPVTVREVIANLMLMQDLLDQPHLLVVLWTLPMEVQMYLALPFCYLAARSRSFRWMALVLVVGWSLTAIYQWGIRKEHLIHGIGRFHVLSFVPCFLMGVLAFWLLRRKQESSTPWPAIPSWTWLIIIVVDIAVLYFAFVGWRGYFWVARALYCAILVAGITLAAEAAPSIFTRVAHTIAVYSYGIYLIHMIALRATFGLLPDSPAPVQWVAFFVTLTALVYVAFRFVEKPGIALGQRLLRGGGPSSGGEPPLTSTLSEATAPPP